MNPKTSFTHFFKIQKTPEVQPRKEGLSIHTNAGIIYDNFEELFYGVQSESEGYTGKAPEKVIIALNKNRVTSPYQITKSYDKIEDWGSLPKVYGSNNGDGYCKTDKSVIIPLDSKLVNGEKITDRIKNNITTKHPKGIQTAFSRFSNNRRMTKDRLETMASYINAMA